MGLGVGVGVGVGVGWGLLYDGSLAIIICQTVEDGC